MLKELELRATTGYSHILSTGFSYLFTALFSFVFAALGLAASIMVLTLLAGFLGVFN